MAAHPPVSSTILAMSSSMRVVVRVRRRRAGRHRARRAAGTSRRARRPARGTPGCPRGRAATTRRRRPGGAPSPPRPGDPLHDVAMDRRVADDAVPDALAPGLELRLHERDDRAARRRQARRHGPEDEAQRDERHVDDRERGVLPDRARVEVARVDAVVDHDAPVAGEPVVELPPPDVDGVDARGAAPDEDVREATGRRPDVDADPARRDRPRAARAPRRASPPPRDA